VGLFRTAENYGFVTHHHEAWNVMGRPARGLLYCHHVRLN
jgi:hypothetical protein